MQSTGVVGAKGGAGARVRWWCVGSSAGGFVVGWAVSCLSCTSLACVSCLSRTSLTRVSCLSCTSLTRVSCLSCTSLARVSCLSRTSCGSLSAKKTAPRTLRFSGLRYQCKFRHSAFDHGHAPQLPSISARSPPSTKPEPSMSAPLALAAGDPHAASTSVRSSPPTNASCVMSAGQARGSHASIRPL